MGFLISNYVIFHLNYIWRSLCLVIYCRRFVPSLVIHLTGVPSLPVITMNLYTIITMDVLPVYLSGLVHLPVWKMVVPTLLVTLQMAGSYVMYISRHYLNIKMMGGFRDDTRRKCTRSHHYTTHHLPCVFSSTLVHKQIDSLGEIRCLSSLTLPLLSSTTYLYSI